ncbi:hypothetical protein JYP52_03875 [Nitratireductor aquibiodomus]|uniref:hypothetical protein n=1 Tax=Nitratireductor TaxID=245876 RepID=UPI0013AE8D9F|nr:MULTISPECIES: hypothetical protein [Nitratireductor]MBN7760261.1 hypothetical protein [Nitratireductor aquibiodomus]MCV0348438.1 hypothetical protein [Nitratireductor sp.]
MIDFLQNWRGLAVPIALVLCLLVFLVLLFFRPLDLPGRAKANVGVDGAGSDGADPDAEL